MATPQDYGAFIPTTNIWDVSSQIMSLDVNSPEFKELLIRLYQNINNVALSVNIRDAGYYDTSEFVNGQLFFPNPSLGSSSNEYPAFRQVFRKVINFGALPNAASKSVAHGIAINSSYTFTRIYATASDVGALSYIPIPYASPTSANNIELSVNSTTVTINSGINRSNYTVCYVILEYIIQ